MAWRGVCSTIFCYQHSLPIIVKGFFKITSWNLILSIVLLTRSLLISHAPPPPPKGEGEMEAREQACVDVPSPPFHLGWEKGGGGGESTAARRLSVCLCMPNAWDTRY